MKDLPIQLLHWNKYPQNFAFFHAVNLNYDIKILFDILQHVTRRDRSGADSVTSFLCRVWFGNIA